MNVGERRIAYVVNHAAFFVSHRLPLAVGARQFGFDIALFTGQAGSPSMEKLAEVALTRAGVLHQRVAFRSASINPVLELWGLVQLIWLLWRYCPQVVHCASPKGVLYGGIAARICGTRGLVLAVSGMGYAFTGAGGRSLVRTLVGKAYMLLARFAFHHPNLRVIVQNQDDKATLIDSGLVRADQLVLIPGSGVSLEDFAACSAVNKQQVVLLPARMLRDKGVEEFAAAARKLHQVAPDWRFVLAGAADYQNPTAVSPELLHSWQQEGFIEWCGHVDDMVPLFASAAIVCLPSYREGMPKALLEAAAAACAVVTTDVTGCREAVLPGVTGDLVPARNSEALAEAILSLINDPQRRMQYGASGQKLAINRFAVNAVMDQTYAIYQELSKDV